jgi:hypothetical protein
MITDTPRCDAELRKSTKSGNTNCVLSAVCRCHGGALGDTKTLNRTHLVVPGRPGHVPPAVRAGEMGVRHAWHHPGR